jgi:hypothetical protein
VENQARLAQAHYCGARLGQARRQEKKLSATSDGMRLATNAREKLFFFSTAGIFQFLQKVASVQS